jgi:hypothetical protein
MSTAIVIAKNERDEVLIGQSSPYLIDHPDYGLTANEQRVYFTNPNAKKKLSKTFNELLSRIPSIIARHGSVKIKISKESIENKGAYFSGKYRSDLALYPPGLIKGQTDRQAPRVAAQREFKEETGVDIKLDRFIPCANDPNVFLLDLTNDEADDVLASWQAMDTRNEGEVFNLHLEPLATLDRNTLNPESKDALNACLPTPGGRRRRTLRKSVLSRTRRKARRL